MTGRGRVAGRARLVAPPLLALAAALGYLAVADPRTPGHYPACPFRAVTGLECPACGTLRAVHALTRGDVAAAAGFNVLALALLPLAALLWWRAAAARRAGRPVRPLPGAVTVAVVVSVAAFTVLRNSPVGAPLAP
jgi:hypothetical protein